MIELRIEDYCQDCPYFEVETETIVARSLLNGCYDFVLKCEHSEKCRRIYKTKQMPKQERYQRHDRHSEN